MNKSNYLIFLFIIFFLVGGTALFIVEGSDYINSITEERNANQVRIDESIKEIERLNKEIEYRESTEFIEKIAREDLGFVMKDEIIFNVKSD